MTGPHIRDLPTDTNQKICPTDNFGGALANDYDVRKLVRATVFNFAAIGLSWESSPLNRTAAGKGRVAMKQDRKPSIRRLAKATGIGLVAGGLLLGAPAGIAFADSGGDAVEKAVVAGSQTVQQATVAGSQTYQQAVVAGSQTVQKLTTATSSTLSSALKGLFGK
jgi:hypothetical protein